MPYEIDFIGVNEKTRKADAIAFRWKAEAGGYKIGIYDGGLQIYGEEMKSILEEYYFSSIDSIKTIDFVIVSHSDQDHTSGLKTILENFEVKDLYMNRPWVHVKDLIDNKNHGNITENSLERRLKEKYKYIAELEDIATERDIPVHDVFQGDIIENKLTVLSPTKDQYIELLVESSKTPLKKDDAETSNSVYHKTVSEFCESIKHLIETWFDEKLKEDVETSEENEMSIILLGEMEEESFLLTGDAGIKGLNTAITYAKTIEKPLIDVVDFIQIPHHGGRYNVSSSILNGLIGYPVAKNMIVNKIAYVSAAKDSDHPMQMVVNAFIRRIQNIWTDNLPP